MAGPDGAAVPTLGPGRPDLTPGGSGGGARQSCGTDTGTGARAAGRPDLTPGGGGDGARLSCSGDAGARATTETGRASAPTPRWP
ncbi:hypothetical protein OsI_24677 [Oryza sativa Indica Group]|uniref:Uncharacterized protein n=1 Tax=Oryza sativa subsp. indica TaxID=39946 RepID=B8B6S5_ORYSI|nr:hypothetical protein OsI_24677 [Oryza sativa Indica Group]